MSLISFRSFFRLVSSTSLRRFPRVSYLLSASSFSTLLHFAARFSFKNKFQQNNSSRSPRRSSRNHNWLWISILGVNGGIFLLWQYAIENKNRQLLEFLQKHCVVGPRREHSSFSIFLALFSHFNSSHFLFNALTFYFFGMMKGNASSFVYFTPSLCPSAFFLLVVLVSFVKPLHFFVHSALHLFWLSIWEEACWEISCTGMAAQLSFLAPSHVVYPFCSLLCIPLSNSFSFVSHSISVVVLSFSLSLVSLLLVSHSPCILKHFLLFMIFCLLHPSVGGRRSSANAQREPGSMILFLFLPLLVHLDRFILSWHSMPFAFLTHRSSSSSCPCLLLLPLL